MSAKDVLALVALAPVVAFMVYIVAVATKVLIIDPLRRKP